MIVDPRGIPTARTQLTITVEDPRFVISKVMPLAKLFFAVVCTEIVGFVGRDALNVMGESKRYMIHTEKELILFERYHKNLQLRCVAILNVRSVQLLPLPEVESHDE